MVEDGRLPASGSVAVVAGITAGDMVTVFTLCNAAVVAGETAANNIGVVDADNRFPARIPVTVFTLGIGADMPGVFTRGSRSIMAAGAIARDLAMVKVGRFPGIGCMAIVTGIAAGDVVAVFTLRDAAVVARRTATDDIDVIDANDRLPAGVTVAVFALIGGIDMT